MATKRSPRAAQLSADTIANERALSRKDRDALYAFVIKSIERIGDIPHYIEDGEPDRAYALRERMEGQLALLDYLQWAAKPPGRGRRFPILMTPSRLSRVLMLLWSHTVTQLTNSERISVERVYAELEDQIKERERALGDLT